MKSFNTLKLTTLQESEYLFPDVLPEAVQDLKSKLQNTRHFESLTLVNASGACLVIPMRILAKIESEGESVWHRT